MNELFLKRMSDEDLQKLEGMRIKAIKTDGNNSSITDTGLKSLSKVIGLEELDLEWATNISDSGVVELHKLKSLKYIDLSFCKGVSKDAITALKNAVPGIVVEE